MMGITVSLTAMRASEEPNDGHKKCCLCLFVGTCKIPIRNPFFFFFLLLTTYEIMQHVRLSSFRPRWKPRRPPRSSSGPWRSCGPPRRPSPWPRSGCSRRTAASLTRPGRKCSTMPPKGWVPCQNVTVTCACLSPRFPVTLWVE